MNKLLRFIPISVGLLLGMLPALTNAASFGSYDPRSLAMGGTGVSHANIDHAAYFNPALLSVAQEDDDFSLLVPTIGVRLYDPKDLLDAMDAYQDGKYETTFNDAIDDFNAAATVAEKQTAASTAATSAQQLVDGLVSLSDKALDFELHGALGVAIPSKGLGFAVSGNARIMGGIVLNISTEDQTLLQKYVDTLTYVATSGTSGTLHADIYDSGTQEFIDPDGTMTSTASLRGVSIIEGAVSVAHEFESLDDWSIGATPKTVNITTYDYEVGVENADFDSESG
ncbi:MAG: conjugal transfer protein TraF, partial [candidate division Zixibacteria bacterium]|nr:conjugal transfer protein TraF [candidate division Zixibacteria bacterium]